MNIKLKKAFLGMLGLILPFYVVKTFSLPSNVMPTVNNFALLEPQPMNHVIYFGLLSALFILFLAATELTIIKRFSKKHALPFSSLETGWAVICSWF